MPPRAALGHRSSSCVRAKSMLQHSPSAPVESHKCTQQWGGAGMRGVHVNRTCGVGAGAAAQVCDGVGWDAVVRDGMRYAWML
eukprot:2086531-Rhodomonas_salina.1